MAEQNRRVLCLRRAVILLYTEHRIGRRFDHVYRKILRRWPVSASGEAFREKLHELWDREMAFCLGD